MDAKLMSDTITAVRKGLEEFLTPSLREVRADNRADIGELRQDVERLKESVAKLESENKREFS